MHSPPKFHPDPDLDPDSAEHFVIFQSRLWNLIKNSICKDINLQFFVHAQQGQRHKILNGFHCPVRNVDTRWRVMDEGSAIHEKLVKNYKMRNISRTSGPRAKITLFSAVNMGFPVRMRCRKAFNDNFRFKAQISHRKFSCLTQSKNWVLTGVTLFAELSK